MIMLKLPAVIKIAQLEGARATVTRKSTLLQLKRQLSCALFRSRASRKKWQFSEMFTQHFLAQAVRDCGYKHMWLYLWQGLRTAAIRRPLATFAIQIFEISTYSPSPPHTHTKKKKINRPCNEKSPQVKHVTKLCIAGGGGRLGAGAAASGNKDNERVEPLTGWSICCWVAWSFEQNWVELSGGRGRRLCSCHVPMVIAGYRCPSQAAALTACLAACLACMGQVF